MKSILMHSLTLFALCLTIAVTLTLSQSVAQAQEVTVAGSTDGSTFNNGTTTLGGLTFTSNSFSGATSGGVITLAAGNNLGTLTVNPSTIGDTSGTFTLQVLFSSPSGFSSNPILATGDVFGTFTDAFNFQLIDFNNNPQVVNFSGADGTGSFALALNDVCLADGQQCFINIITKSLRSRKLINAFALKGDQDRDGGVKFVKAKGSSSMAGPMQDVNLQITATITLLQFSPANEGQCKKNGWKTFVNPSYKNQGECVSDFARAAAQ